MKNHPLSLPFLVLAAFLLLSPLGAAAQTAAPTAEPEIIQANGVSLACRRLGHGPPLLLIMGYAGTMNVWDPVLLDELAASRTLILFDNRGMGRSSAGNAPFSMSLFAADAAGLLEALHVERADVLGWSMGAAVAQELALARPELVGKIVLVGPLSRAEPVMPALNALAKATPKEFLARLFPAAWLARHPDAFSRLPKSSGPADPDVLARQYHAIADWPGTADRLPDLRAPALLIVGDQDDVTPPDESLFMAERVKGSWLARFPDCGHWLMYQQPRELARLTGLFLDAPGPIEQNPAADPPAHAPPQPAAQTPAPPVQ